MKEFDPDYPLVLGLAGLAGTGKTTIANVLAPQASITDLSADRIKWSHLFYAMPLYELAAIRRTTEGTLARDRELYQIHSTLMDVFGSSPLFGAPPYDKLIEMVHAIQSLPFPQDGSKPREFFQKAGTDIVRAWDENAWVKWMKRKITSEFLRFRSEQPTTDYEDEHPDEAPPKEALFGILISDVRFENEAKLVLDHPNGLLIRLETDEEVRRERQAQRDEFTMTDEQNQHPSESSVELIPNEWYDLIVDTTEMSVKEEVNAIIRLVEDFTGEELYAKEAATR